MTFAVPILREFVANLLISRAQGGREPSREHLEDDTAEVSSKGSDGLVVFLSFGAPQMLGSKFAVAGE